MEKLSKINLIKNRIYNFLFIERFFKKLDIQFPNNIKRWDLIQHTVDKYSFEDYLEIGCDDDLCFSKIKIKNKIGVDPYMGGNFKGTSDDFFSQNNKKFDLIFIDGLHEYDQCLKDVENSLNFLKPNGLIMLHDCLPRSIAHQAIPRYRGSWNGDVWKVIVNLRTRPELKTITCKIDMGIGIVKKETNNNLLTLDKKNYKNLKFKDYYNNYEKFMNIHEYNETLNLL